MSTTFFGIQQTVQLDKLTDYFTKIENKIKEKERKLIVALVHRGSGQWC